MTNKKLTLPKSTDADGFERKRLSVNNGPDVEFEGRVLYEYTTQNKERTKDRWTELRLWETKGGAWIAESIGESRRPGDVSLRDVRVFEKRIPQVDPDKSFAESIPEALDAQWAWQEERKLQVMEFFGWTTAAKAFAREARWDTVRKVD